ncbi:hypothetical protein BS47DRAFT_131684 [Hydnum rufescens UP504]|uniref:Uncharacterized protein n=1 Tax=Hydnum rufescens UP504 TaxID=1448309 RepID=A0A9P6APT3_9AGAM|nr:hypothetical protein BS47DRAFT_131684 [Hydnum rufescens UP504]
MPESRLTVNSQSSWCMWIVYAKDASITGIHCYQTMGMKSIDAFLTSGPGIFPINDANLVLVRSSEPDLLQTQHRINRGPHPTCPCNWPSPRIRWACRRESLAIDLTSEDVVLKYRRSMLQSL